MTGFDVSGLADVPRDTLRALSHEVGEFLLVGMAAVDLVTRGLGGLPPSRLTRDVDIAIAVDSKEAFYRRTAGLTPRGDETSVHFWWGADQVDVVPFGGVAPTNELTLEDQTLDVTGLSEAARSALDVRIDDDLTVRVASLPALVVLKLIAWTDRGAATDDRDAYDLDLLLRGSASGRFVDEFWDDDAAQEAVEYDPVRGGPFRIGRQIADAYPPEVLDRITAGLDGLLLGLQPPAD